MFFRVSVNNQGRVSLTLLVNQRAREVCCLRHVTSVARTANNLRPVVISARSERELAFQVHTTHAWSPFFFLFTHTQKLKWCYFCWWGFSRMRDYQKGLTSSAKCVSHSKMDVYLDGSQISQTTYFILLFLAQRHVLFQKYTKNDTYSLSMLFVI